MINKFQSYFLCFLLTSYLLYMQRHYLIKGNNSCEQMYLTLGVQQSASQSEIKRAFKHLALLYHPDKNNNQKVVDKNGNDLLLRVNDAYKFLKNTSKEAECKTLREKTRLLDWIQSWGKFWTASLYIYLFVADILMILVLYRFCSTFPARCSKDYHQPDQGMVLAALPPSSSSYQTSLAFNKASAFTFMAGECY